MKPLSNESKIACVVRRDITLDGIPASIGGLKEKFGVVAQRQKPNARFEFSWHAIIATCAKDGAFKS